MYATVRSTCAGTGCKCDHAPRPFDLVAQHPSKVPSPASANESAIRVRITPRRLKSSTANPRSYPLESESPGCLVHRILAGVAHSSVHTSQLPHGALTVDAASARRARSRFNLRSRLGALRASLGARSASRRSAWRGGSRRRRCLLEATWEPDRPWRQPQTGWRGARRSTLASVATGFMTLFGLAGAKHGILVHRSRTF